MLKVNVIINAKRLIIIDAKSESNSYHEKVGNENCKEFGYYCIS